mgnify:CR=1 FL=1
MGVQQQVPSVLYIVWNEPIWKGVPFTQATEVVCTMQRSRYANVTLLAFQPLIHLLLERSEFYQAMARLSDAGVRTYVVPTPFAFSRYMLPRSFLAPLFLCVMVPFSLLAAWRGADILHPRGYIAALAALIVGRVLRRPFIFDPRSPFPEEHARAGDWSFGSHHFRLWKWAERLLLRTAACAVVTSETFRDDLERVEPNADFEIIPNNSSGCRGGGSPSVDGRHRLGLRRNDRVIAYVGSIGKWNDASTYAVFHKAIVERDSSIRFLYIVPRVCWSRLHRALATLRVPPQSYRLLSVAPNEVSSLLSVADVGIQLMAEPDPRLGVKIAEYLVAGLPIVVNENARGAAALVRERSVGLVINLDDSGYPERVVSFLRSSEREHCAVAARLVGTQYTCENVAERYSAVYWRILNLGLRSRLSGP